MRQQIAVNRKIINVVWHLTQLCHLYSSEGNLLLVENHRIFFFSPVDNFFFEISLTKKTPHWTRNITYYSGYTEISIMRMLFCEVINFVIRLNVFEFVNIFPPPSIFDLILLNELVWFPGYCNTFIVCKPSEKTSTGF